jgi:hypothetical protein
MRSRIAGCQYDHDGTDFVTHFWAPIVIDPFGIPALSALLGTSTLSTKRDA